MVVNEKIAKDPRVHFTFTTMEMLSGFLTTWVNHSPNKVFGVAIEVNKH
jgi:hypothetical protein